MGGVAVVTDSAAGIPQELAEKHGIHVMPLIVLFGQEMYRDGVDMTSQEFYRRFRESEELPTTSTPSLGDFLSLYTELSRETEGIVSLHVSRPLSGVFDIAKGAARELRSQVPIEVIDTRTATMAQGFIALEAAKAARAGQNLAQVVQRAEEMVPRVKFFAILDTLRYLQRGGRIGRAEALMGSVLQVKPILSIDRDGMVIGLDRPRTKHKALERILELTEEEVGSRPVHMAVMHADALAEAERLKAQVETRFNCVELYLAEFTPVMTAYSGPGLVGVSFWAEGQA